MTCAIMTSLQPSRTNQKTCFQLLTQDATNQPRSTVNLPQHPLHPPSVTAITCPLADPLPNLYPFHLTSTNRPLFMEASSSSERRPLRERLAHITRRRNIASASPTSEPVANTPNAAREEGASSSSPPSPTAPSTSLEGTFECNVCFDVPRDPVVTQCGHLYCWPCLYRWIKLHAESPQCPVCKAGVDKESVIPIYGRGRSQVDDPRQRPLIDDDAVPPRPAGHRPTPIRNPVGGVHANFHHPFGRYATFGDNTIPGNYDFSLPNFGIIPSFLQFNEPPREDVRDNQDEGIPEVGKLSMERSLDPFTKAFTQTTICSY